MSDVIRNNNQVAELSDTYRSGHWKRGIIYSRLDYIFVSNSIVSKISAASTDWIFESSDHATVKVDLTFEREPPERSWYSKSQY